MILRIISAPAISYMEMCDFLSAYQFDLCYQACHDIILVLSIPKAPKIIHPVAEMSEPLLIVTSASISCCPYFVSHPANPSCIYSFQDMFNKRLNVFVTMTTYFRVYPIFPSYFDKPRQQYYVLRHDGTTWYTQNWHMINCQLNPYHLLCHCQILTASGVFHVAHEEKLPKDSST